ncbi:TetR/AcrR family transcriptional regulator [Nocardiopsis mangrovi]|uniref:TetR/AcrR family transcriptional regulator n=1 Tax=Nocardiopsis mangrovi TaxID=1179818 RepID=A0ABV9DSK2_9ACTN
MPGDPYRMAAGPSGAPARLRADARRNRERILGAARVVFADRGIDAPMATIARRAGVGTATLYRRFPTREALIVEAFAEQAAACAGVVERALTDPDPWRAFAGTIERVTAMQVADRGFSSAVLRAYPRIVGLADRRTSAEDAIARLIGRAKAAGYLRADFDRADLTLVFMAVHGVHTDRIEDTAAAVRRLVAHLLRSFRADAVPPSPLPPAPPLAKYPAEL